MAWKTSDFSVPRVEQATAAPGELRVVTDWKCEREARCTAYRIVSMRDRPAWIQVCVLPSGHDGDHDPA